MDALRTERDVAALSAAPTADASDLSEKETERERERGRRGERRATRAGRSGVFGGECYAGSEMGGTESGCLEHSDSKRWDAT
eukprot:3562637-Rhodomonas_salina.1